MKKSYKKYKALYLSVAFFFVYFSFGNLPVHAAVIYDNSGVDGTLFTKPGGGNTIWSMVGATSHTYATAITQTATGVSITGAAFVRVSANQQPYQLVQLTQEGTTGVVCSSGATWSNVTGNIWQTTISGCSGNIGGIQVFSNISNTTNFDGAVTGGVTFDGTGTFMSDGLVAFQVCDSGGCTGGFTPPVVDLSTRYTSFTINQPAGTVTATGYWTASATSTQSQELRFWQVSPILGQESYASRIATTTGNFSFTFPYVDSSFQISATSTSYTLGSGVVFYSEIYQLYDGFNPFSNTGTPPLLLTSTSTSLTATSTVTVDSSDPRSLSGLPEPADCSLSAITGCIKNAAVWLFYPSSDSVDSFKGLSDTLSGKFPFAYAYGINTMRQELFEAAQTSSTTISLTFKIIPGAGTSTLTLLSPALLSAVPYSNTVKIILGWILWLLGIEYIYYRTLRSHDPNTP